MLVTAPEILFFWVARMVMAGYAFVGEAPFHTVYLHGTARDTQGRKMSKSLGNGIDPLDVVALYGADALRYTLVAGMGLGADVFLDPADLEKTFAPGRNFATKLWNIGRFLLTNVGTEAVRPLDVHRAGAARPRRRSGSSTRLDVAIRDCDRALGPLRPLRGNWIEEERGAGLRLNDYAETARRFVWNELADWYLEAIKTRLLTAGEDQQVARSVLVHVFDRALRLLHPIVPFVTEALWQKLPGHVDGTWLATTAWPVARRENQVSVFVGQFELLKEIVAALRQVRSEYNVPPSKSIEAFVVADEAHRQLLDEEFSLVSRLARTALAFVEWAPDVAGASVVLPGGTQLVVPLEGLVDVKKECARLGTELAAAGEAARRRSRGACRMPDSSSAPRRTWWMRSERSATSGPSAATSFALASRRCAAQPDRRRRRRWRAGLRVRHSASWRTRGPRGAAAGSRHARYQCGERHGAERVVLLRRDDQRSWQRRAGAGAPLPRLARWRRRQRELAPEPHRCAAARRVSPEHGLQRDHASRPVGPAREYDAFRRHGDLLDRARRSRAVPSPAPSSTGWQNARRPRRSSRPSRPDSTLYFAQSDSVGGFDVRPLPAGRYLVRAIVDANSNRDLDRNEAFDTLTVVVPLAAPIELRVALRDTLPPRLLSVTTNDSLSLRITFDRPLDPTQPIALDNFRLLAADSGVVPLAGVLTPVQEAERTRTGSRPRPTRCAAPIRSRARCCHLRRGAATPPRVVRKPSLPAPFTTLVIAAGEAAPARDAVSPRGARTSQHQRQVATE